MGKKQQNETAEDFVCYLRAGYPYYFIPTYEMERCISLLSKAASDYVREKDGKKPYTPVVWDIHGNADPRTGEPGEAPSDPLEILDFVHKAKEGTIVFLKNYNWQMNEEYDNLGRNIVTILQNRYSWYCKDGHRKAFVVVSDVSMEEGVPEAIRRDFVRLDFDYPDVEEIKVVLDRIILTAKENKKFKAPNGQTYERLIDACVGLSLQSMENALADSLVHHGRLVPEFVDRLKAESVNAVKGVTYLESTSPEYNYTFENLLGYDMARDFATDFAVHPEGKGIALVGPPGTGKTVFGYCMRSHTNMRMLVWEPAEFQGGIVGETEKNWREAIKITKAMAGTLGVLVLIDEMEKGTAGAGSQTNTVSSDSITKRSASQLLKFMQNPGCKVYFIGTFNSIDGVDGEYLRPGRWDTSPFFVDLPNEKERKLILDHYRKKNKIKSDLDIDETEGWSGAELEAVCHIANVRNVDLQEAKRYVRPMSIVKKEQIDRLRAWAKNAAIPASEALKPKKAKRSIDMG